MYAVHLGHFVIDVIQLLVSAFLNLSLNHFTLRRLSIQGFALKISNHPVSVFILQRRSTKSVDVRLEVFEAVQRLLMPGSAHFSLQG